MKMEASELELRLRAESSRTARYRQWRNWRTGMIIETIQEQGTITEDYWDREFEAVVLFHHPDLCIVFCDPLNEALKKDARHSGCQVLRLDDYSRLLNEYGGENVHGKEFYKIKPSLTWQETRAINTDRKSRFLSAMFGTCDDVI